MNLASIGYIQVRAFTSRAQLPLEDVAVVITTSDGTTLAMRLTNRNGEIGPVEIPVPNASESQSPDPPERPFTVVNVYGQKQGYERIENEGTQVFAGVTTVQQLEMIPLSEFPDSWEQTEFFSTPVQNL